MKKMGRMITSALALTLAFGPVSASAGTVNQDAGEDLHKSHSHEGSPFDLAIANDEKLIEMLKEDGKIADGKIILQNS